MHRLRERERGRGVVVVKGRFYKDRRLFWSFFFLVRGRNLSLNRETRYFKVWKPSPRSQDIPLRDMIQQTTFTRYNSTNNIHTIQFNKQHSHNTDNFNRTHQPSNKHHFYFKAFKNSIKGRSIIFFLFFLLMNMNGVVFSHEIWTRRIFFRSRKKIWISRTISIFSNSSWKSEFVSSCVHRIRELIWGYIYSVRSRFHYSSFYPGMNFQRARIVLKPLFFSNLLRLFFGEIFSKSKLEII